MRTNGKTLLLTLTLAVALIAGALVLIGSACISPIGCGLALGDSLRACSDFLNNSPFDPDTEWIDEPWDGPGSIRTTPLPTPEPVVEEKLTPAPSAAPNLDSQKPAALAGVRQPRVQLRNDGTDTATVLILMNGSDLESEYSEATADIAEMVRADRSDRVNIVIETVGTKKWDARFGISSRRSQRWLVQKDRLALVDDSLAQLDTTVPGTLSDFIRWGAENYPADRYILILWDHGGGPVYGFGYDEFQPYSSTLTIDEMQIALRDGGVYFDLIGMDSCLMSSLEVCCALYEYCDYTLLSEDFEPGCGWSYTGWISALNRNPAIPTPELCKIAIDDTVRYCETHLDSEDGVTLALFDQSYMRLLYTAWVEFAYANEEALLNANYSQLRQSTGRTHPLLRDFTDWFFENDSTLEDYCVTDILSVAQNIESDESRVLIAALKTAMIHYGATANETTLAGLSVTLPYGDAAFYDELKRVFRNAGFDEDYIDWLERFVSVEVSTENQVDFGGWSDLWSGWSDADFDFDWGSWFYEDDTSDDSCADDDWFSCFFGH
jgi:hypothetical protein